MERGEGEERGWFDGIQSWPFMVHGMEEKKGERKNKEGRIQFAWQSRKYFLGYMFRVFNLVIPHSRQTPISIVDHGEIKGALGGKTLL